MATLEHMTGCGDCDAPSHHRRNITIATAIAATAAAMKNTGEPFVGG